MRLDTCELGISKKGGVWLFMQILGGTCKEKNMWGRIGMLGELFVLPHVSLIFAL